MFSFSGFAAQPVDQPSCHLYLHNDGYPAAAAWRFAASLQSSKAAEGFLAAFRHTQSEAIALVSVAEAADADYRYRLRWLPGSAASIEVQCWRRHPATSSWHPRCGPMPLEAFIKRFLPGDPL